MNNFSNYSPKRRQGLGDILHGILKVPFSISQSDDGFKQNRKIKLRGHPDASKVKEVIQTLRKTMGKRTQLSTIQTPVGEHLLYRQPLLRENISEKATKPRKLQMTKSRRRRKESLSRSQESRVRI